MPIVRNGEPDMKDIKQSTAIPPKPFGISHSKMGDFRRCRQRYHWKYISHYYPKSAMGQSRGTAGHAALAVWHSDYDPQKAMNAAWEKWSLDGYKQDEDWQLLEDALNRYFVWSKANDTFKMVEPEYKFEIEYEDPLITFVGYIDGIVEEQGKLWLLENKFWKRVDITNIEMDMQATLYLLAAGIMGKEVNGVIYNIVRIGDLKPHKTDPIFVTEPVVRKLLHRNLAGLVHVQQEVLRQAEEMIAYQKGGTPYRNPTKDCTWDCSFYAPCMSMLDDGYESQQLLESVCLIKKEIENGE
jgi:hypothetical protein